MERHPQLATIAIRLRSLVWFGAGLSCALIAVVGFAATRSAALPGPEETTFVPITPCRLVDTRATNNFTVGPRATPIGAGETHRQPVTGANGRCNIPTDASGVALNVTAVDPTADSFLTLFPFDAELPQTSNLNYLIGSPPTPNKVDVRLSADGEVGIYNAFGTVDVIADVAGYYTGAGLQDLLAILAAKADADAIYTKTETDAALAGKAGIDDVYTKSEIDGRTQMRSISFPIEALRLSDPPDMSPESDGVWWSYVNAAVANLNIHRPADWTGDSAVTIEIAYGRTPNAGDVRFRVIPVSFSEGDATNLAALAFSTNTQSGAGANILREVSVSISSAFLLEDWWRLSIQRVTGGLAAPYGDPVFVQSVNITYEAHA